MPKKKTKRDRGRPKLVGADRWVSKSECAEILGLDCQTFRDKLKDYPESAPRPRKSDHKLHVGTALAWQMKAGAYGRGKTSEQRNEKLELELARERLRLKREEFEFDRMREQMIPISQMELVLMRLVQGFKSALLAFGPRTNERLEGLDFNDRSRVFDEETAVVLRTLEKPDYLHPVADDDDLDA